MLTAQRIIAALTGIIGLALIVRAVASGQMWPLSIQLLGGILLVVMAVMRWRMLR